MYQLEEYVVRTKEGRRSSWHTLAAISLALIGVTFSWATIRNAFYRRGYRRYHARLKPPISETNRRKRLQWAYEHVNWTMDDWRRVLWTDETWVTGGHHRRVWVTRKKGEEWNPTCIVEKHQRKNGWLFWGCFSGLRLDGSLKGPGFFWEKEWGSIDEETYRQHTVPLIEGWIRWAKNALGVDLLFMQDGAPAHKAQGTLQDLRDRGIQTIWWPPYSPDLNPVETVWNWMKDYIEDKYGLIEKPSHNQLRQWTKEAWDAVPDEFLEDLLASMPTRCQAVIEANGMHIKY